VASIRSAFDEDATAEQLAKRMGQEPSEISGRLHAALELPVQRRKLSVVTKIEGVRVEKMEGHQWLAVAVAPMCTLRSRGADLDR